MVGKELKRLSRRELVDIIYQLKKNEQEKLEQIAALEEELRDRRIRISVAGSIAEAAIDITNVFSAAQSAADRYLHEIERMKEDTEAQCARKIEETDRKVAEILQNSEKKYDELEARCERGRRKWEQLRAEIQKLEEEKMRLEREMRYGKKN
ncbi:MAG: hypothetical protein IJO88_05550 [Oscillospiraceae bacterium]|nr:hypothetical protein [Oscillospiraceae bacterium]